MNTLEQLIAQKSTHYNLMPYMWQGKDYDDFVRINNMDCRNEAIPFEEEYCLSAITNQIMYFYEGYSEMLKRGEAPEKGFKLLGFIQLATQLIKSKFLDVVKEFEYGGIDTDTYVLRQLVDKTIDMAKKLLQQCDNYANLKADLVRLEFANEAGLLQGQLGRTNDQSVHNLL